MSFYFYLYRGPEGLPPVAQWASMLAQPLGTSEEVRGILSGFLQGMQWINYDGSHSFGKAVDPRYNYNFHVYIHENDAGMAALN